MALKIGDKAPEFSLQNTEGSYINLSDFKKKRNVVLLFFPLAFTSTCTEELCSTRDNLKIYESLDAEVLGISSADSFFVLKEFKKAQNINFQLLSDFNKNAAEAYGTLYKDFFGMKGVSKRSSFVVDKEGVLTYSEILDTSGDLPNFESIMRNLSEIENS